MIWPSKRSNDTSPSARSPPNCIVTPLADRIGPSPVRPVGDAAAGAVMPAPVRVVACDAAGWRLVGGVVGELGSPVPIGTRPCGAEPHDHDEGDAEEQQPVLGELAQLLGQHEQQRRTEHRTGTVPMPPRMTAASNGTDSVNRKLS